MLEYNRKWRRTEKGKKYHREYMRKRRENPIWREKDILYERIKRKTEKGKKYAREYMRGYMRKNRIGQERKKGELFGTCGLGRKYELLALKLLKGSMDCNQDSFHGGHDLLWNKKKIEVKMRNKRNDGCYSFRTKKSCDADYYLLFCVNNAKIEKIFFVPSKEFKKSLDIYKNPKYNKYLILTVEV